MQTEGWPHGRILVIDEEGKLKDKPLNAQATMIFRTAWRVDDWIVGDAVLVAKDHWEKEDEEEEKNS